jgi:membrane associated rhomboid family serine protease
MALPVSYVIIFANVFFSMMAWKNRQMMDTWMDHPYSIYYQKKWYKIFSSQFIHADWMHLIFNSITLFFFGPSVEIMIGTVNFILAYIISQIISSITTLVLHYKNPEYRALGASGAILGILYIFIVFQPMAPIYLMFIPIGIPAFLFGIGFLVYSMIGIQTEMGRISHEGHLGGALAGLILGFLFKSGMF